MEEKNLEVKIEALKDSIDTLLLLEFAKCGAKRDDVRAVLGSLDNNLYSKINKIVKDK